MSSLLRPSLLLLLLTNDGVLRDGVVHTALYVHQVLTVEFDVFLFHQELLDGLRLAMIVLQRFILHHHKSAPFIDFDEFCVQSNFCSLGSSLIIKL